MENLLNEAEEQISNINWDSDSSRMKSLEANKTHHKITIDNLEDEVEMLVHMENSIPSKCFNKVKLEQQ